MPFGVNFSLTMAGVALADKKPSIAVVTNGAALGSIIEMILSRHSDVRVVRCRTYEQLADHMRIAPADLIICDYEQDGWTASEMLVNLRRHAPGRHFRSIVLTSFVSHEVRQGCRFAQVDEVVIKPMSPLFLLERVEAHLAEVDTAGNAALAPQRSNGRDNVVPLFSEPDRTGGPRAVH